MVVQLLGLIDIIAGASFLFDSLLSYLHLSFLDFFVKIFGAALLIKGGVFAIGLDFMSILDVICAIIILASLFYAIPIQFVLIISAYLILKGIASMKF